IKVLTAPNVRFRCIWEAANSASLWPRRFKNTANKTVKTTMSPNIRIQIPGSPGTCPEREIDTGCLPRAVCVPITAVTAAHNEIYVRSQVSIYVDGDELVNALIDGDRSSRHQSSPKLSSDSTSSIAVANRLTNSRVVSIGCMSGIPGAGL